MTLLITGATGFIGRHLCARLTQDNQNILVMLRDPDRQWPRLRREVDALGGDGRLIQAVQGNLDEAGLGLQHELPELDGIIHLGARFGWQLDRSSAHRTNVAGSLEVAELARVHGCRLVFVSGFMLENRDHLRRIGITSDDPERINWKRVYRRAGAYEASKLEAAIRVRSAIRFSGVDMVEVQPATVAGHSDSGEMDSGQPLYTVLHNLSTGRLNMVPGTPSHWLPLVPVDHLAALIGRAAVSERVPSRILALDPDTPNLQQVLGIASRSLGRTAPKRHLPMPVLTTLLRIPGVAHVMNTAPESLHFIQPTRFDTSVTDAFLKEQHLHRPSMAKVITTTSDWFFQQANRPVPGVLEAGQGSNSRPGVIAVS